MPYMMGQMGMNVGPGQNVRYPGQMPGQRMGVQGIRPQGFQQIPPSGPMMRQQQMGPMGLPPGDLQQQRMRFPQAGMGNMMGGSPMGGSPMGGSPMGGHPMGGPNMAGPNMGGPNMGGPNMSGPSMGGPSMGGPNVGGPPKQVSMSHPSPQPPQGGGAGPPMWNSGPGGHPGVHPGGHPIHHGNVPMGSGSPHPHSPMQPTAIASPRPPGKHFSQSYLLVHSTLEIERLNLEV